MAGPNFPKWNTPEQWARLRKGAARISESAPRSLATRLCRRMERWIAVGGPAPTREVLAAFDSRLKQVTEIGSLALARIAPSTDDPPALIEQAWERAGPKGRSQVLSFLPIDSMRRPHVRRIISIGLRDSTRTVRAMAAHVAGQSGIRALIPELRACAQRDERHKNDVEFAISVLERGYHASERSDGDWWLTVTFWSGSLGTTVVPRKAVRLLGLGVVAQMQQQSFESEGFGVQWRQYLAEHRRTKQKKAQR